MATPQEQLAKVDEIIEHPNLSSGEKLERLRVLRSPKSTTAIATPQTNGFSSLSPDETIDLITSNLQETLDKDIIENVIRNEKRPLKVYWGTAPTGRPHCGYFVPMLKIAELLRAGAHVKILLADIHAFLDNLKAPIELVNFRAQFYKYIIVGLMNALTVPIDKLEFVLGRDYQISSEYQMDLLRACTQVTVHAAKKAGAEVVKQVGDEKATLSSLIYPIMQALDEEYLDVDVQLGGVDQRKIFTHAKELLPRLKYKQRAHLMNPMVPGLAEGGKMSASVANSKIDVLEAPDAVRKKISKAHCVPKEVEGNGILALVQYTLLPASALRLGKPHFEVERRDADKLVYDTIEQMHEDYRNDVLNPQDLKAAVTKALNELLAPIQATFNSSDEWQRIAKEAYPPDESTKLKDKPKKEKKNKGSMYPGSSTGASTPNVETQPDGHVEGQDKEQLDLASSATAAIRELKADPPLTNGK